MISQLLFHMKSMQGHATIIIDVFRAFTTASYVLARSPARYLLTTDSKIISELALIYPDSLLIGKSEKNNSLIYDIPNSPTRTQHLEVKNKTILHRTEAGAKGVLQALKNPSDIVLAAGLVNADATVGYLKKLNIHHVNIIPMGHEATTPSLEDDICALYIHELIRGNQVSLKPFFPAIRTGAGRYFFSHDQWQYPQEDFLRCLKLRRFNFAIQATANEDYAVLERRDIVNEER